MKRYLAFILLFATAGFISAQDMPPLPPLPNQAPPAGNTNSSAASPALPPLPDQPAAAGSPALPPLPEQQSAPASSSPALPPLPGQAAEPAAPAAPANNTAPALPPLPGQPAAPAAPADTTAAPAAPAASGSTEAAPDKPAETAPPKKDKEERPWEKTKWRPNVIFGGWVKAKGGNESSRIAWASQEVLNALLFKGYKIVKPEEGKYDGQENAGGNQTRNFTFKIPKSSATMEVFLKTSGKKVWMRVGPAEPPPFSVKSIAQVQKQRDSNLKALHLIQKKFGRRLSAHHIVKSFEAPYRFNKESADE